MGSGATLATRGVYVVHLNLARVRLLRGRPQEAERDAQQAPGMRSSACATLAVALQLWSAAARGDLATFDAHLTTLRDLPRDAEVTEALSVRRRRCHARTGRRSSKSEVSRMAATLDEQVEAFRTRRLTEDYPCLWLDALYIKVRENHRRAIQTVLVGTTWQRCTIHFRRNVLTTVNKTAQDFVAAAVKAVFQQPDAASAKEAMTKAIDALEHKYPAAAELLREAEDDVLAYMSFPNAHWRQIHSTNPLERLNKEIRRRTRTVGIFPNDAAVLRLVGMVLIEQNDEWAVGRRYFSLASMHQLLDAPTEPRALEVL